MKNRELTVEEKRQRQEAIDYARVSVELEGFKLSPQDLERARSFVEGKIKLVELVRGTID